MTCGCGMRSPTKRSQIPDAVVEFFVLMVSQYCQMFWLEVFSWSFSLLSDIVVGFCCSDGFRLLSDVVVGVFPWCLPLLSDVMVRVLL